MQEKSDYLFESSVYIDHVKRDILAKIIKKEESFFLIDETQANVNSKKNDTRHRIMTIGAGVPAFESLSSSFARKLKTSCLFVADEELTSEGVIWYFVGDENVDATIRRHIECLLANIRSYVGGHVYPLMRLAELLVPKIKQGRQTANQAINLLNSA